MRVRFLVPIPLLVAGALAAGCAGGPPQATTADLARAHALVAEAERDGAQQYAPADLQEARDKAQQADELANHGDAEQADRLANEAALDAQLSSARASDGKAQHDLAALNQSLATLRGEEDRNSSAPPVPQQAAPTPSGAR